MSIYTCQWAKDAYLTGTTLDLEQQTLGVGFEREAYHWNECRSSRCQQRSRHDMT